MERFENRGMAGTVFDDVNLSRVSITNANIQGLTIFGYDVAAMVKKALEDDGRR